MEINIDKSNWSKVNFGDVAIQMKGTVDRDNTDLKYYVKGEHMNSEDVHIRTFGELTDEYLGPAFIRHFKDGDILYGSRRTYLKKVAVAHFEGITSNTTFVINAKENVIDKRLLPFLMLSDEFTEHSIMHSKGSVNPYINWKDLANYEFLLPPKEQQVELADLLWAMDEVIEKDLEVLVKMDLFKKSNLERLLFNPNNPEVKLRDYISEKKQVSTPPHRIKKYVGLEHLISGRNNIDSYGLSCNVLSNCFKVEKGDLLYSKLRPYLDKAVIADSECVATTELIILETESLSKRTVLEILHSARFLDYIKDKGYGTKMPRVNFNIIGEFGFNLPRNIDVLEKKVIELDQTIGLLRDKLQASKTLQKALINQIF